MRLIDKLKVKGFISKNYIPINDDPDQIVELYHKFMKEYGWIPFSEFTQMPIPLTLSLLNKIHRDNKQLKPMPVVILGFAKKSFVNKLRGVSFNG